MPLQHFLRKWTVYKCIVVSNEYTIVLENEAENRFTEYVHVCHVK